MMAASSEPTPERRSRPGLAVALAIGCAAAVLAVGLLLPRDRVWTDGRDVEVAAEQAMRRDVVWIKPESLGKPFNTSHHEYEPGASGDGEMVYFNRGLPGRNADIYASSRDPNGWTVPQPVRAVNTEHDEIGPRVSLDGQWLAFYSNRPGGEGGYDIYLSRTRGNGWARPDTIGAPVNSEHDEYSPSLSSDGQRLYFASNRPVERVVEASVSGGEPRGGNVGPRDDFNIYVAEIESTKTGFRALSVKPVEAVNTVANEGGCWVTPAGDFLYFASDRVGGVGGYDLYRARITLDGVERPENLGPAINSEQHELGPVVVTRGFEMFFASNREGGDGGYDLYRSESRELFAQTPARRIDQIGWSWWALALAAGTLIVMLAALGGEQGYRRLNLLQRCVLISLMVHVALTMMLSLVVVSKEILEFVAPDAGMVTAVNLDVAREVEVTLEARQTVTELPSADPTLDRVQRAVRVHAPTTPRTSVELSMTPARPTEMVRWVEAQAPPIRQPGQMDEVSLPSPRVLAPSVDEVRVAPPAIRLAEPTPPSPSDQSPDSLERLAQIRAPVVPAEVRAMDRPVEPGEPIDPPVLGLAEPKITPNAVGDEPAPRPRSPQSSDAVAVNLTATGMVAPIAEPDPVEPTLDQVESAPVQAASSSPTEPASGSVELSIPAARPTPDALQLSISKQYADAASATVVLDMPSASLAPSIALPTEAQPLALPVSELEDVAAARESESGQPRRDVSVATSPHAQVTRAEHVAPIEPDLEASAPLVEQALTPARQSAIRLEQPEPQMLALNVDVDLGAQRLVSPPALFQRSVTQRQKMIEAMGGTAESEHAVDLALEYLAKMQEHDGRWTQVFEDRKPTGRKQSMDVALSSLATLCFLAADHTHRKEGPYRDIVEKSLTWLSDNAKPNGDLRNGGDMYGQAMATLAMAEAAIMTGDEALKETAIAGAGFIVQAQHKKTGGWRYEPGDPGDTSVFGWQIMALESVSRLGEAMPRQTHLLALTWLDRVTAGGREGVLSGYQNRQVNHTMTAEALFCRVLLGQALSLSQRHEVGRYINSQRPPKGRGSYYYWYYASLGLMQVGGEHWERWNQAVREHLIDTQEAKGPLVGSWPANSQWARRGGRIYSTALSTLTLQVYYRYLPMYRMTEGEKAAVSGP